MDDFAFVLFVIIPVIIVVPVYLKFSDKKRNKNNIRKTFKEVDYTFSSPSSVDRPSPFGFPEYGFKKMADFSRTQLIGGTRFLENYRSELISLYENDSFMSFIRKLRKTVDGGELTGTKLTNRKIANTFYYQKINDSYPEVNRIAQAVRKYGSQASAHISIYYAMFILEEDEY